MLLTGITELFIDEVPKLCKEINKLQEALNIENVTASKYLIGYFENN